MRALIKKPVNCGLFISQDRKILDVSAFMTVTATCQNAERRIISVVLDMP